MKTANRPRSATPCPTPWTPARLRARESNSSARPERRRRSRSAPGRSFRAGAASISISASGGRAGAWPSSPHGDLGPRDAARHCSTGRPSGPGRRRLLLALTTGARGSGAHLGRHANKPRSTNSTRGRSPPSRRRRAGCTRRPPPAGTAHHAVAVEIVARRSWIPVRARIVPEAARVGVRAANSSIIETQCRGLVQDCQRHYHAVQKQDVSGSSRSLDLHDDAPAFHVHARPDSRRWRRTARLNASPGAGQRRTTSTVSSVGIVHHHEIEASNRLCARQLPQRLLHQMPVVKTQDNDSDAAAAGPSELVHDVVLATSTRTPAASRCSTAARCRYPCADRRRCATGLDTGRLTPPPPSAARAANLPEAVRVRGVGHPSARCKIAEQQRQGARSTLLRRLPGGRSRRPGRQRRTARWARPPSACRRARPRSLVALHLAEGISDLERGDVRVEARVLSGQLVEGDQLAQLDLLSDSLEVQELRDVERALEAHEPGVGMLREHPCNSRRRDGHVALVGAGARCVADADETIVAGCDPLPSRRARCPKQRAVEPVRHDHGGFPNARISRVSGSVGAVHWSDASSVRCMDS